MRATTLGATDCVDKKLTERYKLNETDDTKPGRSTTNINKD